jgi:hypothetical protein
VPDEVTLRLDGRITWNQRRETEDEGNVNLRVQMRYLALWTASVRTNGRDSSVWLGISYCRAPEAGRAIRTPNTHLTRVVL